MGVYLNSIHLGLRNGLDLVAHKVSGRILDPLSFLIRWKAELRRLLDRNLPSAKLVVDSHCDVLGKFLCPLGGLDLQTPVMVHGASRIRWLRRWLRHKALRGRDHQGVGLFGIKEVGPELFRHFDVGPLYVRPLDLPDLEVGILVRNSLAVLIGRCAEELDALAPVGGKSAT